MWYCHDCNRETTVIRCEDEVPYEFWGETGWYKEYFMICEICGSYNIQECYLEVQGF